MTVPDPGGLAQLFRPRSRVGRALWCAGWLVVMLHLLVGVAGLLDDGCPHCETPSFSQVEIAPSLPSPRLISWPCAVAIALREHFGRRARAATRAPPAFCA